ncbi:uncharacterized protein LOC127131842 [Lathyrus oleraceus]|uniref:uncharacterized protein LOC127131842 n=1 Tax=Pisum sativum TaxID=3888 RepID=UPI0021D1E4B1|nr:uncharacterized protein LOC127131842 [Pisum sativum]
MCLLSPEKSKDKEESDEMSSDLADKEENLIEKKDQSTNIVNIEDLNSDDIPISQRLAPGIAKRLKNIKGQAIESSNMPSKSLRRRTSVGPTKKWSKVVTHVSKKKSLKRKEVPSESSEFVHDVEHNVQDIVSTARKQAFRKKIPTNISEVPIDNISFHSVENRSKEFRKVYVRGKCVDFSPEIINRFLGRNEEEQVEVEVSDNVIYIDITAKQVKEWPKKGKMSASDLSVKYVVLHRIGDANWVPINHTSNITTGLGKFIYIVGTKSSFDFGSYVFDQTMKHVVSYAMKMPIAFPLLICGVIVSQHPSILISSNSICKRNPSLSLHYRLFTRKYVPYIVMTSGQTSSRHTTRIGVLAELKDTCKTLDETIKTCTKRKRRLGILIKALYEEEGNLKGDGTCEKDANEEGTDATDDEETTNSDVD